MDNEAVKAEVQRKYVPSPEIGIYKLKIKSDERNYLSNFNDKSSVCLLGLSPCATR